MKLTREFDSSIIDSQAFLETVIRNTCLKPCDEELISLDTKDYLFIYFIYRNKDKIRIKEIGINENGKVYIMLNIKRNSLAPHDIELLPEFFPK